MGEAIGNEEEALAAAGAGLVGELDLEFAGAEFGNHGGAMGEDAELAVPTGDDGGNGGLVEHLGFGGDEAAAEGVGVVVGDDVMEPIPSGAMSMREAMMTASGTVLPVFLLRSLTARIASPVLGAASTSWNS